MQRSTSCSSHLDDPDIVSPSNLELLKRIGSPKAAAGRYQIFDRVMDSEIEQCSDTWDPANYLGIKRNLHQTKLILLFKGFIGELNRKRDFSLSEYWLLFRGGYSPFRLMYRGWRRLFEKRPTIRPPGML